MAFHTFCNRGHLVLVIKSHMYQSNLGIYYLLHFEQKKFHQIFPKSLRCCILLCDESISHESMGLYRYCSYCLCCFLQSKQGAVIRRNDENSHHTRSQGELVHLLMDISRYDDVSCNRPEEILHRIGD